MPWSETRALAVRAFQSFRSLDFIVIRRLSQALKWPILKQNPSKFGWNMSRNGVHLMHPLSLQIGLLWRWSKLQIQNHRCRCLYSNLGPKAQTETRTNFQKNQKDQKTENGRTVATKEGGDILDSKKMHAVVDNWVTESYDCSVITLCNSIIHYCMLFFESKISPPSK